MRACSVRIVTESEGERSVMTARARGFLTSDGFEVTYREEGDAVTLSLCGGVLFMERTGSLFLSANFAEGGESNFLLRHVGGSGKLPVRTFHVRSDVCSDKIQCELAYELFPGTSPVPFRLLISIDFSEVS